MQENEEPVLVSQKSISTTLGILIMPLFSVLVVFVFLTFSFELGIIVLLLIIAANIYFFIRYLKVPKYKFYNEYFTKENKISNLFEKMNYADLEGLHLQTDTFSEGYRNGVGTPLQGKSQNETLCLRLKNGNEIIFEESMYDNFKLIRKLFTELSEKEDTSRLN